MQHALQLVEDVAAGARGERLAFDDGVDERRLGLEHRLDEIVDGVPGDEVGDVDRAGLADPVGAVFGLPVIGRHPVEIVEHHLRRRRQVQPVPPATMFATKTRTSSSLWKRSTSCCRIAAGVLPVSTTAAAPNSAANFWIGSSKHEKTITFSP